MLVLNEVLLLVLKFLMIFNVKGVFVTLLEFSRCYFQLLLGLQYFSFVPIHCVK